MMNRSEKGKYNIFFWCSDCLDTDMLGCFDGNKEFQASSDDLKELTAYGDEKTHCCPMWDYEIQDKDGKVLRLDVSYLISDFGILIESVTESAVQD